MRWIYVFRIHNSNLQLSYTANSCCLPLKSRVRAEDCLKSVCCFWWLWYGRVLWFEGWKVPRAVRRGICWFRSSTSELCGEFFSVVSTEVHLRWPMTNAFMGNLQPISSWRQIMLPSSWGHYERSCILWKETAGPDLTLQVVLNGDRLGTVLEHRQSLSLKILNLSHDYFQTLSHDWLCFSFLPRAQHSFKSSKIGSLIFEWTLQTRVS